MNGLGYIVAGYAVTFASIGAYVLHLVRRGRALGRQLPPEERRWT